MNELLVTQLDMVLMEYTVLELIGFPVSRLQIIFNEVMRTRGSSVTLSIIIVHYVFFNLITYWNRFNTAFKYNFSTKNTIILIIRPLIK